MIIKTTMIFKMVLLVVNMFLTVQCGPKRRAGWADIALQCRDDDDRPVDCVTVVTFGVLRGIRASDCWVAVWTPRGPGLLAPAAWLDCVTFKVAPDQMANRWYMYKRPDNTPIPFGGGLNYSYLTSEEAGRWKPSRQPITGRTMLTYTLTPLFKRTYQEHLAAVVFTESVSVSSSIGVLLADEISGAWVSHTIPNFPNVSLSPYYFPPSELSKGHLFVCVSLTHAELEKVAASIKRTKPAIIYTHFADDDRMKRLLPTILNIRRPRNSTGLVKETHIETRKRTQFTLTTSTPDNKTCLYRTFAKQHHLTLDVFSQSIGKKLRVTCKKDYGMRHIQTYSFKYEDGVFYIGTMRDYSKWTVSANRGTNKRNSRVSQEDFWLCTSNIEMTSNPTSAGILLCINNVNVWAPFDSLKITEPKCPKRNEPKQQKRSKHNS